MRLAVIAVAASALISTAACGSASATAGSPDRTTATAGGDRRADTAANSVAERAAAENSTAAASAEWREITLPAGTRLPVVLETPVGSDTSRVEERVQARVSRPVVVRGVTVIPQGSNVTGVVTDATRSGKVKGRAHVAVRFESLTPRGSEARYEIRTAAVGATAAATKKKDAMEIGGGAAGGALIGALVGGKKGALIGSAAGGGAGTAVVLSTRGKEIHLPRGSALTLRLVEPLTVKVRS